MPDKDTAKLAEEVSLLMQLDRMRHHVGTELDMKVMANVPDYVASVFEEANKVGSDLTPSDLYALVNKRISQVQAQLYLMRLEMENRFARDPAKLYEDPLVISAYGERVETLTKVTKSFGFEPAILAHGWYPVEISEGRAHRWMRPGDLSVACVPHLGTVDQELVVTGHVLRPDQLPSLTIRAGTATAEITPAEPGSARFTAVLKLTAAEVKSANYLPVEFLLTDFRQPNEQDTRMLGANISGFTCRPPSAGAEASAGTEETAQS